MAIVAYPRSARIELLGYARHVAAMRGDVGGRGWLDGCENLERVFRCQGGGVRFRARTGDTGTHERGHNAAPGVFAVYTAPLYTSSPSTTFQFVFH